MMQSNSRGSRILNMAIEKPLTSKNSTIVAKHLEKSGTNIEYSSARPDHVPSSTELEICGEMG